MAAWRLAQNGHEVTALERFQVDHDLGSSYGDSRIVRRVYPDPFYTALMADSYALWDELEGLAVRRGLAARLVNRCGGIFFGPKTHPHLLAAQSALDESRVPYDVWTPSDRAHHFPALRLVGDEIALHEPSMGFVYASRCVRAAAGIARSLGAHIHEEIAVVGIEADGAGVIVTTEGGEKLRADRLLIAAGAWTQPLLATLGVRLPLTVTRQIYVHLAPALHSENFESDRLPVWIDAAANAYGFPHTDGEAGGVKLALHNHGDASTPESVDRCVNETDVAAILRYAGRRFEGLSERAVYARVCLYTNTPDSDFIIDSVPGFPAVTFVSACSGHGFKFTPLLGKIAADLVTNQAVPYDLSRFRLDRFDAEQLACTA